MDTVEENALTSSMLDDVFFIIKKCLRFVCIFKNPSIYLKEKNFHLP